MEQDTHTGRVENHNLDANSLRSSAFNDMQWSPPAGDTNPSIKFACKVFKHHLVVVCGCGGVAETVYSTQPEWSRWRPTSAQRDLERQAKNSPSEMLYPPGVDHGLPLSARVPDSLRGMGSSCSPEQLDGLAAVKGVRSETDQKVAAYPP
ncbi:hypothetical protein C8R43DRAFT_1135340 [Mycena crocata]|nr:hypothetical protein C8R43DRAFT_1135340 [Mycena crocata]